MKLNLSKIHNPMLEASLEVLKILSDHGEAYLVGGAVRDLLIGNKPKDFDISTSVDMGTICGLFNTHDIGKNKDFGIVVVKHRNFLLEIANFRKDGIYTDNRRPDKVELGVSFEEDTKRRDFTFNSLGMDLEGNIIDYHNGFEDLKNKVLKTVGNAEDRFKEDALRILRAVRFAIRFDLTLDETVVNAIKSLKWSLKNISCERIKGELEKMVSYGSKKFSNALELMNKLELTPVIFDGVKSWNTKGINTLKDFNSYDFVVCLSVIFQTQKDSVLDSFTDKNVLEIMENLKFTNEEQKEVCYILDNLGSYNSLPSINKKEALRIVSNLAFNKLRVVYMSISGTDFSEKTFEEILEYNVINIKRKFINQVILEEKVTGRNFGLISDMVIDWLFVIKENNGTIPEDIDIERYVKLTCLTIKK